MAGFHWMESGHSFAATSLSALLALRASRSGEFHLDGAQRKVSGLGLRFERLRNFGGHGHFLYFLAFLTGDDLRTTGVGIRGSRREVAIDDSDVMDQAHLLQCRKDSIDADNIDLATLADDFLVDGIGAERGPCVRQSTNDLDTGHGDAEPCISQFRQSVLFVKARLLKRGVVESGSGLFGSSFFHLSKCRDRY